MKKFISLLSVCFLLIMTIHAQTSYLLKGKVVDESGEPLIGVNVYQKDDPTKGVITDVNGDYMIDIKTGKILVFKFIGFNTQEQLVTNQTKLIVELISETTNLDEVVVTALGIKRETKSLGYAVDEVQGDDIAKVNTVGPVQALQGKATGVSIMSGDGGIFGNSKIQVRGVSVLNSNNNQPIFVVDGVILQNSISASDAEWTDSADDWGGILKNLNADDYESVSVLKGAAATALYGSRGINGAIVIKTKEGSVKKGIGVNISQTIGIEHVYAQPDVQYKYGPGTAAGFINYGKTYKDEEGNDLYYQWDTNQFNLNQDGKPSLIGAEGYWFGPKFDGQKIETYDHSYIPYKPVKDHILKLYDTGFSSNTNIALQGGTDKATFYLSDSYMKRTGIVGANKFTRNALLAKAGYKFTDWLKADVSLSYTISKPENPWNGIGNAITYYKFNNMYDRDTWDKKHIYTAVHGGLPRTKYGDKYANVPGNNIWFRMANNSDEREETVVRPIVRLTAELTDWLTVIAEGNINHYTYSHEIKSLGDGFANEGGSYSLSNSINENRTGKFQLMGNKSFLNNDLNIGYTLGSEFFEEENRFTRAYTDGGLTVPGKYFLANSKKKVRYQGNVNSTREINSLYYILNFGYKNQLYLDVTGRNDWSSTLTYTDGTGNNSYFYPSISASWIFTETFNLPEILSFGKLRASWAQVGNDTGCYTINKGYGLSKIETIDGKYVYSNNKSTTLVNPSLKPEMKNSKEVGLDLRFYKNRLNLDVAYYNETIDHQIGTIGLPSASGYSDMLTNIGTMTNKGIEITLGVTPIRTTNFEYTARFSYWDNETVVDDFVNEVGDMKILHGSPKYGNFRVASYAVEGGKYGILMSDSKPKIFKNEENPDDPRNGKQVLKYYEAGKSAYVKRSGKIEEIGSMQPDWEGSMSHSFKYKNLHLNIGLDGRFGGYVISFTNRYGTSRGMLESSLKYRDAESGGLAWTSNFEERKNRKYNDGYIYDGVFDEGIKVKSASTGKTVDVSGKTHKECVDAGILEPSHGSFYHWSQGAWGTGVINDNWVDELDYIALRNISIGYDLPKSIANKIKANNLYIGLSARNIGYLYNSLPNNLNPESFRGNSSSSSFKERSFSPYTATYSMTVKIGF